MARNAFAYNRRPAGKRSHSLGGRFSDISQFFLISPRTVGAGLRLSLEHTCYEWAGEASGLLSLARSACGLACKGYCPGPFSVAVPVRESRPLGRRLLKFFCDFLGSSMKFDVLF